MKDDYVTKMDLGKMEDKFDDRLGKMEDKFDDRLGKMEDKFDDRLGKLLLGIGEVIDNKIDARLEKLEAKLLDWKSEIVNAVDVMSKEIVDGREYREISSHQIGDNTERIENLEKKIILQ